MKQSLRALFALLGALAWPSLAWAQGNASYWCGADGCRKTFWLALLFGALGGLALELTLHAGNLERPHWRRKEEDQLDPLTGAHAVGGFLFDLGFVARILIGALAAVAVLWVIEDATGMKLMGLSLVAGFAGQSVFEVLKDRLLGALKQQTINTQADLAKEVQGKISEGLQSLPAARRAAMDGNAPAPDLTSAEAALQAAWSLAKVIEGYGSK